MNILKKTILKQVAYKSTFSDFSLAKEELNGYIGTRFSRIYIMWWA